jgi:signal transduction histidine kinase
MTCFQGYSQNLPKSEHGTGLGLFISKSIIDAHYGKIWAENNKGKKELHLLFHLQLEDDDNNVVMQLP